LIRTEQELFGSVEPARKKNPDDQHSPVVVGTGVIYALGLVGAAIYFWPVTLGLPIVHGILAMPFSPVASHLKKDYQRDAERDYAEARRDFDAGEYEQALEEWEKARVLMPSIQTDSDINYWRGRAFESLHHRGEALIAYNRFLEDSTTTPPPYFQHQDDGDAKWKEKEADAVRRLNAIVAAGIGALPDLRSSVSTISLPP
jgi:tetratricopeptide (TPR) repeat protein